MELLDDHIALVRNKTFSSITYLLCNREEGSCIIVDPGLDSDLIISAISSSGLKPLAVLSTHGHFDHIGSAKNIQTQFGVPFYLHEADYKMSQSANFFLKVAGIKHVILTPKPDVLLKGESETLHLGGFEIGVLHLPGHSNGSCVFRWKHYLLTGDILYKNGLGAESIPKEDKTQLRLSILKLFNTFPHDCLILPGHGQADTLGSIKQNNLALKNFIQPHSDATT